MRQGESIAGAGARGKRDLSWATATDMAIDAMFFRNRLETLSRADRLGGSEEEHAAIAQGEMKKRQDFVLRFRLQIDEEIAAANEINVGEGRVSQYIVNREDHAVAQFIGRPGSGAHLG